MKNKWIVSLIIMTFVILGCSSQDREVNKNESSTNDQEVTEESQAVTEAEAVELDVDSSGESGEQREQERMVIFQGEMAIEVKDYHNAANAIKKETERLGGYVVESSYHEEGAGSLNGTIIIRVPKSYFHSFLEYVAKGDGKVLHQSTHGNDVTEEYIDLDSRLESKRIVEERLLGFMEEATSTDNLLKISNELAKVQEEIEQMIGRMKYLENQVDLSTLTIFIQERRVELSSLQDEGSLNTWDNAKQIFISTINFILHSMSRIFVLVIGLSPIIIPVSCLIVGLIIWKKKKSKIVE